MRPVVVIGAGPAGLTAAYELAKHGRSSVVLERDTIVGGISRTCEYRGFRFDIGGHRFFTKVPYVQRLWEEILDEEFLTRPRVSRILYRGRFFDYPLRPLNALFGLGPLEALRIGLSYLKAQLLPSREERTFDQWVTNRFGRRLFEIFFKTYTEKVWGMPSDEIGADWAAQRIKNLDLVSALQNALLSRVRKSDSSITTLIEQFHYPRFGPGQMWDMCATRLESCGAKTVLDSQVVGIRHAGGRVQSVSARNSEGVAYEIHADQFISSMPIRELVRRLDPAPPVAVLEAAERLRYRDFLTVVLIVDRADVFPDNWIYIHSDDVKVGRIQNFKNWSPDMVPDPEVSSLGLEYFVHEGDDLWSAPDAELVELGRAECEALGLISSQEVVDGTVVRMRKAYPVYDNHYRNAIETIRSHLASLPNLQLIGRNGQHRYNNQDHSMMTGVYAARNIIGEKHDIWDVNVEQEYHEEIDQRDPRGAELPHGDRLVPQRAQPRALEPLMRSVFAHYDGVALGTAVGCVMAVGLLVTTLVPLLQQEEAVGPTLSLLGHYLLGYEPSLSGALLGSVEAGCLGFAFGWSLARVINWLIDREARRLLTQIEASTALD